MSQIAIDALTRTPFELQDDGTLREVRTTKSVRQRIAPGFIDLQVNGFGGVDYNRPDLPHTEIARSIRSLYATGNQVRMVTLAPERPGAAHYIKDGS